MDGFPSLDNSGPYTERERELYARAFDAMQKEETLPGGVKAAEILLEELGLESSSLLSKAYLWLLQKAVWKPRGWKEGPAELRELSELISQQDTARALCEATRFCTDLSAVTGLLDPIVTFPAFFDDDPKAAQMRELHALTLAERASLCRNSSEATHLANRIGKINNFEDSEFLQVQIAKCLVVAASVEDDSERLDKMEKLFEKLPLVKTSSTLQKLKLDFRRQASSRVLACQEKQAELLSEESSKAHISDHALRAARTMSIMSCYDKSESIQRSQLETIITGLEFTSVEDSVPELLHYLFKNPIFWSESGAQDRLLQLWGGRHRRPKNLLEGYFQDPRSSVLPLECFPHLIYACIRDSGSLTTGRTLTLWDRFYREIASLAEVENRPRYLESYFETLAGASSSAVSAGEALRLAERVRRVEGWEESKKAVNALALCVLEAVLKMEDREVVEPWVERLKAVAAPHDDTEINLIAEKCQNYLRPFGKDDKIPSGFEPKAKVHHWNLYLSKASFTASNCRIDYHPFAGEEYLSIDFDSKRAAYLFEGRLCISISLSGLTRIKYQETTEYVGDDTTYYYTVSFEAGKVILFSITEDERFGGWDRALPYLSGPISDTARELARRLEVPLTRG